MPAAVDRATSRIASAGSRVRLPLTRVLAEPILRRLAGGIGKGSVAFQFPDGGRLAFAGDGEGPDAVLHLHSLRAVRRLLTDGYLGLGEGYVAGDWWTPSLPDLFDFGTANMGPLDHSMTGIGVTRVLHKALHGLRRNSRPGSRRNIASHYDLGNAFFREWLDPSMAYSAALFTGGAETLAQAQAAKFGRIVRELGIQRHHRVLEIGCGWGGLAAFIARETGARVTAITISREQHARARELMAAEGLSDRVDVQLRDYREVAGSFDRIVSVEMLEAVGERYWPAYFQTLARCLKSGGAAMLQVITVSDDRFAYYRSSIDFIQKYIFPGGMLLCPGMIRSHAQAAELRHEDALFFGASYARTLDLWNAAFQERWPAIAAMGFDERFKRMWEYYLAYTAAGFRAGSIDVGQFRLSKP